jgi:hypothetical protein
MSFYFVLIHLSNLTIEEVSLNELKSTKFLPNGQSRKNMEPQVLAAPIE